MQINVRDMRKLLIPVPALAEQTVIAEKLDMLSIEVARLRAIYLSKILAIRNLKEGLLQKAFSGELTAPPLSAIKEAAE